jgi:lipoate-protein ligase B
VRPIEVEDLGRLAYEPAFERQRQVHAAVLAGERPDTLLLVEHEPVVTVGRRPRADRHIVASPELLRRQGVEVCPTNRGGDVTYHGPGQIVAYPIVDLNARGLNLRQYVWLLEQAIIDTLAAWGIEGRRDAEAVGVWVGGDAPDPHARPGDRRASGCGEAKIAAIGVRAQKWVTMHGLALNVDPNLDHFRLIVPCGLADRPVTSMKQQLGPRCPAQADVRQTLTCKLVDRFRQGPPE